MKKIKNYFLIKNKLYFIQIDGEFDHEKNPEKIVFIQSWKKTIFYQDLSKEQLKEVKQYNNGNELPEHIKKHYLKYVESKLYKWPLY